MDIALVKEYGVHVIAAITAIGGLVVGYRARKLTNKKTEIGILQEMISSLESRLLQRDQTIDAMRQKMNEIFDQNLELMTKMGKMEKDYHALQKSYNQLNKSAK